MLFLISYTQGPENAFPGRAGVGISFYVNGRWQSILITENAVRDSSLGQTGLTFKVSRMHMCINHPLNRPQKCLLIASAKQLIAGQSEKHVKQNIFHFAQVENYDVSIHEAYFKLLDLATAWQ